MGFLHFIESCTPFLVGKVPCLKSLACGCVTSCTVYTSFPFEKASRSSQCEVSIWHHFLSRVSDLLQCLQRLSFQAARSWASKATTCLGNVLVNFSYGATPAVTVHAKFDHPSPSPRGLGGARLRSFSAFFHCLSSFLRCLRGFSLQFWWVLGQESRGLFWIDFCLILIWKPPRNCIEDFCFLTI